MQKKIFIGLGIIIGVAVIVFAINFILKDNSSLDEQKFKEEYEAVNNLKWESDGYNGKYLKINIPLRNLMKYATDDTILDLVTSGTQVIYFGNAKCNWCRAAVPILIETGKEYGLEEIYYYDFFALRAAYEDGKNPKLVKLYESLMDEFGDFVDKTFDEDSNVSGKKRLSAPSVLVVSSGTVVDFHYKTVESHIDYNKNLNSDEKKELKDIYLDMFKKLVYVCDGEC